MVDCRESKRRYRADHLLVYRPKEGADQHPSYAFVEGNEAAIAKKLKRCAAGGRSPTCSRPSHSSTLSSAPTR